MIPLREWIMSHEGYRGRVYKDTTGHSTIGYGRNLDALGISRDEAELMLDNDIKRCKKGLEIYPWYTSQPPDVKDALINMCFNMGLTRLLGFKKMIAALERKDYKIAAIEALDSLWARQVPNRAKDVALVIRQGN